MVYINHKPFFFDIFQLHGIKKSSSNRSWRGDSVG